MKTARHRPTWGWFGVPLAALVALVALGMTAQRPREANRVAAASDRAPRPRLVLPTIKTSVHPPHLYVAAIKRDGTTWERTLERDPLVFAAAYEVRQARGARAFGTDLVARTDGGFVTRQPFSPIGPDSGWIVATADHLKMWEELPVNGQSVVQLVFPDRYLFSGGTLVQKDVPLGTRIDAGRLTGFFAARNVVQFGLGRAFLTALFSDGSLVSTARADGGASACLGRSVVSMAVSDYHGAAVLADGRVAMWGDLSMNQLGTAGHAGSPLTPVPGLANITQVAIGSPLWVLAVALDRAGHVWTWGATGPTAKDWVAPRRVGGLDNVVYVDYGLAGLALKKDGTVWAFNPGLPDSVPVQVFDDVKQPEVLTLPAVQVESPCSRPRATADPHAPSDDGVATPAQRGSDDGATGGSRGGSSGGGDNPIETPPERKPPSPHRTAPSAAPRPAQFLIVGRYACEDANGVSKGTVAVTTRSQLSCADARRAHEQLKATKGGDFCAAAVPGSHTAGVTFVQAGPCRQSP